MTGLENEATLIILGKSETGLSTPEGWILKSKTELLKPVTDIIKMKSVSGSVLYIILLCLAMLAIFDTQVLSIFRRQKEIGTFIALGMTRSQVIGLFTLEGSLNSVFAAALAAIYGIPPSCPSGVQGTCVRQPGKIIWDSSR